MHSVHKKLVAITSVFATLSFLIRTMPIVQSQPAIGVKVGEWIEYTETTTGVPVYGHDLKYARMEIVDIQGNTFLASVVSQHQNGSWSSGIRAFNLEDDQIQAWVISLRISGRVILFTMRHWVKTSQLTAKKK
jgi:hypothetical protein